MQGQGRKVEPAGLRRQSSTSDPFLFVLLSQHYQALYNIVSTPHTLSLSSFTLLIPREPQPNLLPRAKRCSPTPPFLLPLCHDRTRIDKTMSVSLFRCLYSFFLRNQAHSRLLLPGSSTDALVSVALALLDQILDLVGGGVLTTDKQMTYESKLIPSVPLPSLL